MKYSTPGLRRFNKNINNYCVPGSTADTTNVCAIGGSPATCGFGDEAILSDNACSSGGGAIGATNMCKSGTIPLVSNGCSSGTHVS